MALYHRLKRLEKKSTPVAYSKCPTCGWSKDPDLPREFVVVWRQPGEPDTPQPSDFCATCGHQWGFHVKFDKCG